MHPPFLVAGAAHWDIVARAAAPLSPGADVPGRIIRRPGGVALNIALGLAAAGQPVTLIAAIGSDSAGDALAALIAAGGVGTGCLRRFAGETDAYVAIETGNGTLHAAVADCTGLERTGPSLLAALDAGLPMRSTGTLVLDGNLPAQVLERAAAHPGTAAARIALVPASPAKAARFAPIIARRPSALYVNREEAEVLAGRPLPDSHAAALALRALGAESAIVTDGAAPATSADAGGAITLAPPGTTGGGVTGAGDCFVARHLAARADGLEPASALCAALAAAARHLARSTREGVETK